LKNIVIIILLVLVVAGGALIINKRKAVDSQNKKLLARNNANASDTKSLRIDIPQGIVQAVFAAMQQYRATHPDVKLTHWVETPEAMVDAIRSGKEKPDIFISPGGHEALVLAQEGYVDPNSLTAFGSYDLAVLVPKANPANIKKPEDLLSPKVKTISFSVLDLNSSSYAAKLAFEKMGIWEGIKNKAKECANCSDANVMICRGQAEANIQFNGCPVDLSDPKSLQHAKSAMGFTFPPSAVYAPRNVAGIMKNSSHQELAQEFVKFLTSPEMQQLMAKNRMRNDRKLPLQPGPWSPEQEKIPAPAQVK
jgi:ABC-type molybdate transport system substrate-binding protein